jgi:hypothetical protein
MSRGVADAVRNRPSAGSPTAIAILKTNTEEVGLIGLQILEIDTAGKIRIASHDRTGKKTPVAEFF